MGAWIEIMDKAEKWLNTEGRTPRWVRGLKYDKYEENLHEEVSHPTMGAWIEII